MLKFNITNITTLRGITKPYKFFVQNGFSSTYATKLVKNDVRSIELGHLEKICTILKCTPNDIIQWIPGEDNQDPQHPLISLKREDSKINDMMKNMPIDKLKNIENFILSLKEKQS
jgi:DNA-binding Xre family transcriptional regulator